MPQTSYSRIQPIGFPGMKSSSVDDTVTTGVSEETTAELPFGIFASLGVNQDGVKLPLNATDPIMGVTTFSHAAHISYVGANSGVVPKAPVDLMRKGRVYVTSEDAVTPASKVFMRYGTSGARIQQGAVRGTADANCVELYGCSFVGSCAAGGLVELEVDFLTNKSFLDHG